MKVASMLVCSGLYVVTLVLPTWAAPVVGRIVDENHKPVSGAKVRVSLAGEGISTSQNLITDENGSFTAEIPDKTEPAKTENARIKSTVLGYLQVVAPGLALSQFSWKAPGQSFTLAPGQTWGGLVLGEDEKPLAGVRVMVSQFRIDGESIYLGVEGPAAKTDADGRWKIENLPLRGSAQVAISDPRYQARSFPLPLSKTAPPLWAHPGATVRGRLLQPDGTPLVNAQIYSLGSGIETIRTDAKGNFVLSGFAPGDARLGCFGSGASFGKFAPAEAFVVLPLSVHALKVGETRDIGDWKAEVGTLVTGQVVDKSSKKPILGASVMIYDAVASSSSHYTDAKGYYEVRVSSAGANSGSVRGENHLSRSLNGLSIPKGAATFDMATIELEPGVRVAGTATIEGGAAFGTSYNPFALTAKGANGQSQAGQGEASGSFSFGALQPGSYSLAAGWPSNYSGQTNRFTLVSPTSFTVPPIGQQMAPLAVILKALATNEALPARLVGRVVDDAGRGVSGAIISFKNGNYSNATLAVSGEDGEYEVSDLAADAKLSVESMERPGYIGGQKPPVTREGETLRVADFVVKRRGARFVGRVLDAGGKPVAGATVAPIEVETFDPVQSAADGTFVLLDLPAGDFTLLAAKDRLSAMQKTSALAQNLELRLAPPAPIDTAALVEKWLTRGGGWWGEGDFDRALGVEKMEQLALKGAKTGPVDARTAQILAWFLAAAAQNEPAWTRQNADRLLAMFPNGASKKAAETTLAIFRAQSAEADDQNAAKEWLEREKAEAGNLSPETVTRYLSMARVARALKLPEATGMLDFAAQFADQLPDKTRLSNASKWGASLARSDEATLTGFIENWDAPARLAAWGGAARGLASMGDIEGARRALKTLEELAKAPAIKAANANQTGIRSYESTPELVIQGARGALVRALSERDPAAALIESAGINDDFAHQNALLWVANGARLRGDKTTATTAIRQVFEFRIGNTEPFALAAWYGAQIDPALGSELFAKERTKLERKTPFGSPKSIGDVAYYLARLDPAQSRFLVEREWLQRTPSFGQKSEFGGVDSAPTKLVRAMLVIDPARGAEMAAQLEAAEADVPDPGRQRGRERTGWISALVTDAAAQARGDLETRP